MKGPAGGGEFEWGDQQVVGNLRGGTSPCQGLVGYIQVNHPVLMAQNLPYSKKQTFVLNTSPVWLHLTIDNHTQSTRVSCTADYLLPFV